MNLKIFYIFRRFLFVHFRLDEKDGFGLLEQLKGPNPDSATLPAVAYVWKYHGSRDASSK